MKKLIVHSLRECMAVIAQLDNPEVHLFIENVALTLASAFQKGQKVLIAGNGGSLCDAVHFAEELTGYYRQSRPALPALALADSAHITCVGNDVGFESVFSRGIEAYGQAGDVFVGLTTSGNSQNIIRAFEAAKMRNLKTVAFLGKEGGQLKGFADLEIIIQGFKTSDRIQEAHMAIIHILIEMVEEILFPASLASQHECNCLSDS
ncbi:SIS domain-containing protein [Parachlamydia sp. AcF125]|uniref:D-sedoheptulose-7-phosphate isomerase n=1 Tax=Parachlamydia sp. AcF125 TaxID=2795736 RepID=UPI001BCA0FFE|nr:SIS domain-containing protein [Parachlamydia sp. AcF125]MBS4167703.1 Phosphoheptose isomerase [Parachlamydia sp. AcF125]